MFALVLDCLASGRHVPVLDVGRNFVPYASIDDLAVVALLAYWVA